MAGIYIHIPFCRRACHYCDFHFTTNLQHVDLLVNAILAEIELQKDYLKQEPISTIYFGGGTPTLLPTTDIAKILKSITSLHSVNYDAEITIEANPEDLSHEKLKELKQIGINRLSLGTQSFIDSELKWMNRMHTAKQAIDSINNAQRLGFNNISIDLIFGLPKQTEQDWTFNLKTATSLNIQHISSYGLTVENKTVLNHRIKNGIEMMPDEEKLNKFLKMNMEYFPKHGFEQYEISNFASEGFISQHNSSYWKSTNYLGIGPSAHSFNGVSRQWNLRSNGAYTAALSSNKQFFEREELSIPDRINEHILTGLRTKWGIRKSELESIKKGSWKEVADTAENMDNDLLSITNERILLTASGVLIADKLTSDLFV